MIVCPIYIALCIYGRIMQTSASTPAEAIVFELSATVSEVSMSDVFLRGETPMDGLFDVTKQCKWSCKRKIKTQVRPMGKESETSLHIGTKNLEAVETLQANREFKRRFAITCILVLSLVEASSIIVSIAFVKIWNINFGPAGGAGISNRMLGINLTVMMFGEVVLSDGFVSYLSSRWKNRYLFDISEEWERRDRFIFRCFYVILASLPFACIQPTIGNMCYTSYVGTENYLNPVLTTCPLVPGSIDDMISFGASFLNVTGTP